MLTERIDLPLVIGGENVRTGLLEPAICHTITPMSSQTLT